MRRRAEQSSARAITERRGESASSSTHQERLDASPTAERLVAFAEELGRLLARRELAKIGSRRAYSMAELVLGASVMATAWVLIARALGWLAH